MSDQIHPAVTSHLPFFITAPGQTDTLFNVMVVIVLLVIVLLGGFYFHLHALPERMAHRTNHTQMQLVAVLALIALFTHQHIYWIGALILAFVKFPDFRTPAVSIADSLERIANRVDGRKAEPPDVASPEGPALAAPAHQEHALAPAVPPTEEGKP
jgi:hypothetical protein